MHRHGTVAADSEDIEQLLEVRAMVLVVAVGDGQPQPPPQRARLRRILVVAMEGHGGRVVVQLVERDVELAGGVGGKVQRPGGDVGLEEAVEGAADPVVVEGGELIVGQSEEWGVVPCGPFADAVERLA
jgi:hypothetical protein